MHENYYPTSNDWVVRFLLISPRDKARADTGCSLNKEK